MNELHEFAFEFVTVDDQGRIDNRLPSSARYFTEDLGDGVTMDMVIIPAGKSLIGASPANPDSSPDEYPQHEVTIATFCLGRYAVTQAQYQAVMGSNPSMFKSAKSPVEMVNWHQAMEFCRRLGDKTEKGYRLPSEAEWEYACKAETNTPFSFGSMITTEVANFQGEVPWHCGPAGLFRGHTIEVGHFPPNPFGLYDMHGNVFDWCEDVYHPNYEHAPQDGSAWITQEPAAMRVLRGGSWYHTPIACVSTTRLRIQANYRAPDIGFRVALFI
jgi:formylglycine-generating enzyme required for sulfatase activity